MEDEMNAIWFVVGLVCGAVLSSWTSGLWRRAWERRDEKKDLAAIVYGGMDASGRERPGLLSQLREISTKVDALGARRK